MDAATEMQQVWKALSAVRSRAVKTLKRDFPDLYAMSGKAFGGGAPVHISHHSRLGRFLTEWESALGTCPIEALALGRHTDVLRELVDRANMVEDDSATSPVEIGTRNSVPSQHVASSGVPHIAYFNYAATGEGQTVMIALGGSAQHAKTIFQKNTPDYFRDGMEVKCLADTRSAEVATMLEWIPQAVMDCIKTTPAGTSDYYGTFHVNLS